MPQLKKGSKKRLLKPQPRAHRTLPPSSLDFESSSTPTKEELEGINALHKSLGLLFEASNQPTVEELEARGELERAADDTFTPSRESLKEIEALHNILLEREGAPESAVREGQTELSREVKGEQRSLQDTVNNLIYFQLSPGEIEENKGVERRATVMNFIIEEAKIVVQKLKEAEGKNPEFRNDINQARSRIFQTLFKKSEGLVKGQLEDEGAEGGWETKGVSLLHGIEEAMIKKGVLSEKRVDMSYAVVLPVDIKRVSFEQELAQFKEALAQKGKIDVLKIHESVPQLEAHQLSVQTSYNGAIQAILKKFKMTDIADTSKLNQKQLEEWGQEVMRVVEEHQQKLHHPSE